MINPRKWILKSASPGNAIVSRANGQDFMQVTEGSDIPGLGAVLSIDAKHGRWVVRTTGGFIYQ